MVARPLGSVGRTARPKRRARNSPYRGDRYRVFDRLEGQLSPRRAGVRLLGSRNRSGRHHPWVSDRQNRCYCLVANFKYVWLELGEVWMDDIAIVAAARTPVGSFNGTLGTLAAHQLAVVAIKAAMERAKLEPGDVDEVILGQILATGEGQNPARQAARQAGIPDTTTAFGINQLCGSGLRSVALAAQQIRTGESDIVIAGGMESMSQSQHAAYLRSGTKMGGVEFVDTLLRDGLWDAFHGYHMGVTAENVAQKYQITRIE